MTQRMAVVAASISLVDQVMRAHLPQAEFSIDEESLPSVAGRSDQAVVHGRSQRIRNVGVLGVPWPIPRQRLGFDIDHIDDDRTSFCVRVFS
jgi:hypothetical protein